MSQAEICGVSKLRFGSTMSQASAPKMAKRAATKNDICHPKCAAIRGVSEVVHAPPICAPMFMTPEDKPAYSPAKLALTAQKQPAETYRMAAPRARTIPAVWACSAFDPSTRRRAVSAIEDAGSKQRPRRKLKRCAIQSLATPPDKQPMVIPTKGSIE